jgi:hypothetical protein
MLKTRARHIAGANYSYVQDSKTRLPMILPHERNTVDCDCAVAVAAFEISRQQLAFRIEPLPAQRTGQRHVEPEILEHVGVAPTFEIIPLTLA